MISPHPDSAAAPPEVRKVLKEAFGLEHFREGQEEVIAAVLAHRDVLCVMPTGAGKSLCYQLPALMLPGVTLVVSPLISLMRDQVETLRERGIAAAAVNSAVPLLEQDEIMDQAARGELKLLYVAPERFRNERFRRLILAVDVSLIAVDEAHCISQWGHDFRPDYRRLGPSIEALDRPHVLALTATAPPEVQEDVVEQLHMKEPLRVVQGIVRKNLVFDVLHATARGAKDERLLAELEGAGASLVYAATRKSVDRLHELCRARGLDVLRYHAGLDAEERTASQDAFLMGTRAPLMIATNAFGMGIDRPDIRRVIHYDIPRTVEAYVQETGRAGRDGEPAHCLLLFNPADLHVQRFFLESSNPSREVVTGVFRVLLDAGESRLELTAEEIANRMRIDCSTQAVSAALAILDRASVVRRGKRGENRARVTVLPSADSDLFTVQPLPPGLSRLLASLVERFGVDQPSSLDISAFAAERRVTEETVRRGLSRLHTLARVDYVPPFRGRATEMRGRGVDEDALEAVDFAHLEAKRRHEERKLDEIVGYAHATGCRVQHLLRCFGVDEHPRCERCDRCRQRAERRSGALADSGHALRMLRTVVRAVKAYDKRYGFRKLAGHLAGSKAEGVGTGPLSRGQTYGAMAHLGVRGAEEWLRMAHDEGLLRLVPHKLTRSNRLVHTVALSPAGLRVLKGEPLPSDSAD